MAKKIKSVPKKCCCKKSCEKSKTIRGDLPLEILIEPVQSNVIQKILSFFTGN